MNELEAALSYQKQGYSVIPIRANKKPYVKWEPYQTKRAEPEQIRAWWDRYPNAMIGIVTGDISDVDAVDCDSEAGRDALNEFLPESFVTPVSKTPKGYHFFLKHRPGLSNGVRVLKDTDLRTTGGYVIVPPSKNGTGKAYAWMPGLKIGEVDPAPMPDILFEILRAGRADPSPQAINGISLNDKIHILGEHNIDNKNIGATTITNHNKHNISFEEGVRDNSLFHVANCLAKGGMDRDNILKCLLFIGSNCSPPFPEKEILAKVESAFKRFENRNRNLTAEIRDWLTITWHNISITNAIESITTITNSDRPKVTVIMNRLVQEGILERVPNKFGFYRKVDTDIEAIDFMNAETQTVPIWLPFGLHEKAETMPGNIIVVAGSPNAGKTAFLLNVVRHNMHNFDVHYFNSEMGNSELRKRLDKFDDIVLSDWKFKPWERADNFADVIKPGKGKLNIIDFLEIYDNFYEIGGRLAAIHNKLKGAVAIVAVQKNPGIKVGLGGYRGLEKPRLYLAMDTNKIIISKCKNWATSENPNYLEYHFKIVNGCKFIKVLDWHIPMPKQ